MDFTKLVMCGHSFGGMTAIAVSKKDPRIAACATLDPWLYAYEKEIKEQNMGLNIPFFVTCTEYFHPCLDFDSLNTLNALLKSCTDHRKENIVMRTVGHLH